MSSYLDYHMRMGTNFPNCQPVVPKLHINSALIWDNCYYILKDQVSLICPAQVLGTIFNIIC